MSRPRDQTSPTQWAPTIATLSFCDTRPAEWATDIERPDVLELCGMYARHCWDIACFKLGINTALPYGADE